MTPITEEQKEELSYLIEVQLKEANQIIDGELVQYIYEDDSDFFTEKKITKAEYKDLLPFYENGKNKLLK